VNENGEPDYILFNIIEPNDIKQGTLANGWLLSAIAIIAEIPALIERLFLTKEVQPSGVYRLKICKNGEW
jgi:calpain-15